MGFGIKTFAQTGVINLSTLMDGNEGYAHINSQAYVLDAKIGEIYTDDPSFTQYPYLKVDYTNFDFAAYFDVSFTVETAPGGGVLGVANPAPLTQIPNPCVSGYMGYPYVAKSGGSAIIRIKITRKLSAPDNNFKCQSFQIKLRLFKKDNIDCATAISPERKLNIYVSDFSTVFNKADFENNENHTISGQIWNTPDLYFKDNDFDSGIEPFLPEKWDYKFRNISGQELGLAKDPSLWNRHNFDFNYTHQEPMHSIQSPPNPNYLYFEMYNRSCLATPQTASLNLYWTIARLWEPWSQDWLHFNRDGSEDNYIYFPNNSQQIIDKRPTGNEITIQNKLDYSSASEAREIPIVNGNSPYASFVEWIVPNPVWYENQTKFSFFFNADKTAPAICMLSVLDEPWKDDGGLYYKPASTNYTANIVDFVSKNNNVATRNTFALNSVDGYLTRNRFNNNPSTRSGIMMIDNPHNKPAFGIVFRNKCTGDTCENLLENGLIKIHLDMLVWQRWFNAGAHGQNITIIDEQIIGITDNEFATLDSINIYPGEKSYVAIEAEFFENSKPNLDYSYVFDLSPYVNHIDSSEGPATVFKTIVLADPLIDNKNTSFEKIEKNKFSIFPNPSTGNFTIQSHDDNIENITVTDLTGKSIFIQSFEDYTHRKNINLSHLKSGVYFLQVLTAGKLEIVKIVIAN
ncbi:MAG: T9SS type A sorting domain-containing protein [Bacteroidia bacterium]|nr:T9SS type A sorting domain-containing protein [Bacteroidia bacterium]